MKLLVDKMPESPRDCPFSELRRAGSMEAYVCTLRPYIEEAGRKPYCLCKHTETCDRLQPIDNYK